MTHALPPHGMLVGVAAFEMVQLVAASLWIVVVLAAAGIGCRLAVKLRRKRRRMNRTFDALRVSLQVGTYGAVACSKAAQQLRPLIGELLSDGQAALSASKRR